MSIETRYLPRLRFGSGEVGHSRPDVAIELRITNHERSKRRAARSRGADGGADEDGSARGDAQQIVFHEIAIGPSIPEAGERYGLQDPIGNEDERSLRREECNDGKHELVV
jgi:hypothetical protein